MQAIALGPTGTVEIVSVYAAANQIIDAVEDTPGWNVVGGFRMPVSYSARLELIGAVSMIGLTMRARLFDLTTALPVGGTTVEITATGDTRVVSGEIELVGGRLYQMQVEVTGVDLTPLEGLPIDGFGTVKSAQLV